MSKIYEALQIAQEEQLAIVEEPLVVAKDFVAAPSVPSKSHLTGHAISPVTKLYEESELLALAQNIAARLPNPDQNVIQFIGSREGEGTSTLIREFALTAARHSHKPVLLVEADFKKPCQNQAFAIEAKPPLDYVLKEGKPLDGVISQIEDENLFLATLSSKILRSLTERSFFQSTDVWKIAREKFSLILIDSSPVSVSTESLALCETVSGVVLVVEAEKTRSAVVQEVKKQILMREGNLLGLVFTKRKFYIPKFIYRLL